MNSKNKKSSSETPSSQGGVSGCSLTFEDLTNDEKFIWAILVSAYIEQGKEPDQKIIFERISLGRVKNCH